MKTILFPTISLFLIICALTDATENEYKVGNLRAHRVSSARILEDADYEDYYYDDGDGSGGDVDGESGDEGEDVGESESSDAGTEEESIDEESIDEESAEDTSLYASVDEYEEDMDNYAIDNLEESLLEDMEYDEENDYYGT